MALSEIEKLERRFHENPQGLTFAPLAEAYRKSGDPQRAIGVLTPGLELHPDYIPASIVLGRCHLDLKDDSAAEHAFLHVLELDTENVIALKALADITERGTRFGEAARWLEQLLTVDRSNDDAREQLNRVRANAIEQAVVEAGAAATGAAEAAEEAPEIAALDGLESHMLEAPADEAFGEELPPLATVERETSGAAAVESPPVEAFEATVAATPEVRVPDPSAGVLDDAILGVMQLGNSEEIVLRPAEHTEFQVPSASEGFGADAVPDETHATSSEYQLPSASDDLDTAPSVDAANGAAEYQLPSASDELIPEAEAATGASEFQLPDASSTFGGNALSVSDMSPEANEYQSPSVAADLLARSPEPAVASSGDSAPPPAVAPELDAEPGEWVTWSDAALDVDAEPFESEPLQAASPTSLAITEIMEIMQLSGPPAETVTDTSVFREESTTVVDIGEITETMEVPEPIDVAHATSADETETAGIDEPDLVVTESMAELFLKQGHPADALRIYRELLMRRPEDARLAERVASLEGSEAGRSDPLPRYAASASGGTSVRELMRTVLGSRPNGIEATRPAAETVAASSDAPGTPTRPASDHLTLSAIFGEDAAPLPPMSRKPRAAASPPPSERGGVSFDEFYGGGGTQPGTTPRPAGAPPGAGSEDDLDQFHDWLQNLKR